MLQSGQMAKYVNLRSLHPLHKMIEKLIRCAFLHTFLFQRGEDLGKKLDMFFSYRYNKKHFK